MEVNVKHSLAKCATLFVRLHAGVMQKQYHGFQCGVGRIIESPASRDKQSRAGMERFPVASHAPALFGTALETGLAG
jgi:hypothetical protein